MISIIKHIVCFFVLLFLFYATMAAIVTFIRWDFMYTFPGDWLTVFRFIFILVGNVVSFLGTLYIRDSFRILQ